MTASALERIAKDLADMQPRMLRFGPGDEWPLRRKVPPLGGPALLVEARTRTDVERVAAACSSTRVLLVPVGGQSNVVGALLRARPAVYLSLRHLNRIDYVDVDKCLVRCQSGVVGAVLEADLAKYGLTTGMYPQSLALSTVGGWVATRAMGTFSGRYGGIEDVLSAVEVVLPDGSVIETPVSPRPGIGPMLAPLFIGAEGSFGTVTSVTLRVSPLPERRAVEGWAVASLETGLALVRELLYSEVRPAVVRLYDPDDGSALTRLGGGPDGSWLLLLGVVGNATITETELTIIRRAARSHGAQLLPAVGEWWLEHRYDDPPFLGASARPGEIGDAIDVVAWWEDVPRAYREIRDAILAVGAASCVAHVSHVYEQGASLYFVTLVAEPDDEKAARRYRAVWDAAMNAAERIGVAIVHHHGIGEVRQPWLEGALGSSLVLARAIKQAIDPQNIMRSL